jgi:hypothetical protein
MGQDGDMTAWPPNPPQPPPPSKPRPSGWWFVLGGGLMIAAAVVGVVLFVLIFKSLMETDATVAADGEPHRVTVPTDGERMLWGEPGTSCSVTDGGEDVLLSSPNGSFTRNEQEGLDTFDPGSGSLEVTCQGGGSVDIGPAPSVAGLVGGIFAAVLVPMFLGGSGFLVVLVTGILFLTRPPRPRNA